jgi:hypothetical protein
MRFATAAHHFVIDKTYGPLFSITIPCDVEERRQLVSATIQDL